MRYRFDQSHNLVPANAPREEITPEDRPKPEDKPKPEGTLSRWLRLFTLVALLIYGSGVVYSHLVFSQYDRAACYRAGGILGRIWCPEAVDTEGFRVHFVNALAWPAQLVRTATAPPSDFEKAVAATKRRNEAATPHQRVLNSPNAVIEAQRLLSALGYSIGSADGVIGQRTRAAINDFQLHDGMQISGEVTPELIARLKNEVRRIDVNAVETR